MSNLSSSSSITPTPSTFHNTPTQTHPSSVYTSSSPSSSPSGSGSGAQRAPPTANTSKLPPHLNSLANPQNQTPTAPLPPSPAPSAGQSRIPVTPAVLRSIFASSRTAHEERSLSRVAFFRVGWEWLGMATVRGCRFTGFLLSCLVISLAAAKGRGIKSGAALLGVGVV
ncbi:hypothetical protein GY45DRAFT_855893 [Cubamyces sp. BRFM 1775]|nr:hypothetical protein GY45DRAFT_855893 [Cubamyces sp. BRFM 1775]